MEFCRTLLAKDLKENIESRTQRIYLLKGLIDPAIHMNIMVSTSGKASLRQFATEKNLLALVVNELCDYKSKVCNWPNLPQTPPVGFRSHHAKIKLLVWEKKAFYWLS